MAPVAKWHKSEAENTVKLATSCVVPNRFKHWFFTCPATSSSNEIFKLAACLAVAGVSIAPGQIVLQRILNGPKSSAKLRVIYRAAPFVVLYGTNSGWAMQLLILAIWIIEPDRCFFNRGTTAFAIKA